MSSLVPIPSHALDCWPLSSSKAEDRHQRTEEHRGGASWVTMDGLKPTVLPGFTIFLSIRYRLSQEPRSWNSLFMAPQWVIAARECVCVCAPSRGGTRSRSGFWVINKFLSVLKDFGILWQHIDGFRKVLCELVTDVITGLDPAVTVRLPN